MATTPQYNFTVTQLDLDFILKQIKIAEASTNPETGAAENLAELVGSTLLPYGLRTVDGTWNSLLPGMERLGAADNIMPRLVAANLQTADVRPAGFFGPSDPGGVSPTSYAQNSGSVFDYQPRVASNLIVDQTIKNPAAVAAALQLAGSANPVADATTLTNANSVAKAAAAALTTAQTNANAASAALALVQTGSGATAQALITAQANNAAAQSALIAAQAVFVAAQDAAATAQLELIAAQAAATNAAATLTQSNTTLADANQLATSTAATAATNTAAAQLALTASNSAEAAAVAANAAKAAALINYTNTVNAASGAAAIAPAVVAAQTALNTANNDATNADAAATAAQNAYTVASATASAAAQAAATAATAQAAAQTLFNDATAANASAQAAYVLEQSQYAVAQTASTAASNAVLLANGNLATANFIVDTTAAQLASDIAAFGVGSPEATASQLAADAAVASQATAQAEVSTATTQNNNAQTALVAAQAEYLAAQGVADTAATALNNADGNLTNTTNAANAAATNATQTAGSASAALTASNIADGLAAVAHATQTTALADYNTAVSSYVAGDLTVVAALADYNQTISNANAATTAASNALDAYTAASTIAAGSTQAADSAATALTNANNAHTAAQTQVDTTQSELATEIAQNNAAQALVTTELAHVSGATTTATNTATALTAAQDAASAGNAGLAAALAASNSANAALAAAQVLSTNTSHDFDVLADSLGLDISINGTITIENRSPDIGLSPSFNSWMTFFGQFFDHGLDLVSKGGSGTVFVPLLPDDPLYVVGGHTNFMVLTRAQNQPGADGILGTADDIHDHINSTTPFIDQNQTYTSHPSHQVFLREYHMVDGVPMATGRLANGAHGEANWGEIKAQAAQMLGIQLVDMDVHNGPLLATDRYGEFLRGPNGFAQIVTLNGLVEGDPTANGGKGVLLPVDTIRTDHAFLNDIAHGAAPGFYDHDNNPSTPKIALVADSDDVLNGLPNPNFDPTKPITDTNPLLIPQPVGTYDNEMLDRHFITGDGRGNENIGLTAVHSVFHSEHNRLVNDYKHTILASGNLAIINEWLLTDLTSLAQVPTTEAAINALNWDGERLFQAGRFVTEMQYQHLVFEEFARAVQPAIDPFIFSNSADIDPSIVAEFAQVVYRFGHSMLTETVVRTDINNVTSDIGLIQAFLNPIAFDNNGSFTEEQAIGSIVRAMTRQVGNAIDEFVTEALRNNLVGLPLDLAVLNMARARDTGMPSFNEARAQFFAMSGQANLTPYISWSDMAPHLKNAGSIINFIAAYGTHSSITSETTLEGKRDAAMLLVFGGAGAPADRLDFLNSTGGWTAENSGLNDVDFWIGGLAEELNQFGGMLGATFNFVFESQLENLQNGDRFYYLSRTQGTNMLNELEANTFAALVMRNSDLGSAQSSHLPGHLFQTPNYTLEIDVARQTDIDPVGSNPILNALNPLVIRHAPGADVNGDGAADGGYIKYNGFDHMVLGGTNGNDTILGGGGIDTIWGDAGDDRIDAGDEADEVHGGDGDDIITDHGTPVGGADFLRGDEGNDVISSGNGNDIVFGGGGNDFIITGDDFTEVFAGRGDDFVLGGRGPDTLMGNEGNDWIEGGEGFDGLSGENSELFFNSPIIGHDVLNGQGNDTDYDGETGDDIMVEGAGIQRNNGMFGFDWAIHKGDLVNADSDLGIAFFPAQPQFTLRDRFDSVEGLSGWKMNDTLTGSGVLKGAAGGVGAGVGAPIDESNLKSQNVSLINGYAELLGLTTAQVNAMAYNTDIIDITQGAEVIIGGAGNDTIKGNLGNDILDGDAWLNVRISVHANKDGTGPELFTVDSLNEIKARMISGEINPGQLKIVREILQSNTVASDVDTVVYNGNRADYTLTQNTNGTITVAHTNVLAGVPNDGTDTIRNFEVIKFADATLTSAPAVLDLTGNTSNNSVRDQFDTVSYANNNGSANWAGSWTEAGDDNSVTAANGQIRINGGQLRFDSGNNLAASNGASVQRVVNLAGATSATLSYNYVETNFDAGETVLVQFAADGTTFTTVQTINSASNTGVSTIALTGPFSANAVLRFTASSMNVDTDLVSIDNVNIAYSTLGAPGNNFTTSYTENAAAIAIASAPTITDGVGTVISSASVVLTNAQTGDVLSVTGLVGTGITSAITNLAGVMTLTLTGQASLAAYQTAIQAVRFASTAEIGGPRNINVTVNDGLSNSNIATATVNVTSVNDAPVITSNGAGATAIININENLTAVTTVTATDADSPTLTYALAGGVDAARFSINTTSGALRFINAPDFENPTDTNANGTNTYNVTVSVSDGITTDTQAIRVNVLNVNEVTPNVAPVITSNGGGTTAAISIAENGTAVTTITATDADVPAQNLTYSLTGGADVTRFNINAASGALSFINAPNFEAPTDVGANNIYDVIVQVSDGTLTDTQAIAVTVTDVVEVAPNVAPVITSNGGGTTAAISIAENGTAVTTITATDADVPAQNLTYTLAGGADAARFNINAATGALSFINAPNFEAPTDVGANNIYDVIVQVSDGIATDSQAIAVTVTDVVEATTNNPPTGSLHITGYTTNQIAFQDASTNLTATNTINDPDGMTNNVPYQWQQLVGGVWQNIVGATNAVLANQSNNTLRVTSSYTDPFGSYNFISAETAYITGTVANNTIVGSAGNDYLLGLGGFDVLTGGAGNDTIDGGTGGDNFMATVNDGNDVYLGGDGIDRYNLSQTSANVTINLTTGTATGAEIGTDTISGIEIVLGGDGNNTITDGVIGEQMYGRGGNDTIIMTVDNARDRIDTGGGSDTIDYTAFTTSLSVVLNGFNESTVQGSGLVGTTNDVIAAIDNFIAGAGNDTIVGDTFNNQLTGGLGTDTLTGGLGADTFKYTSANQSTVGALHDVITDFLSGTDKLDFSAIDANAATAGDQAFTFNNTAGAAITGAGQLVFSYVGAGASEMTVIQGNLDNNLGADFEVALMGHITFNPVTDIIA